MHHFNYQYYKGSIDLLSHFAKCKNQKCQFQILQEIDFGTIIRIKKKLCEKIFSTLYFLAKYQSTSALPYSSLPTTQTKHLNNGMVLLI